MNSPTDSLPSLWRIALVNLVLYATDMGCALAGFIFGFGLDVKNWYAVVGFMVVSRWVFFVVRNMWESHTRRDKP